MSEGCHIRVHVRLDIGHRRARGGQGVAGQFGVNVHGIFVLLRAQRLQRITAIDRSKSRGPFGGE